MRRLTDPQPLDSGIFRGLLYALRGRYRFLEAFPIGSSVLGRELFAVALGNGPEQVLFAAAFHGQEWLTALAALRLCEDLCEAFRRAEPLEGIDVRRAFAERRLVMVPLVNPDGVDIARHGSAAAGPYAVQAAALGADQPGWWQANARGVDINHNFNAGWTQLQEMEQKNGIFGPAPRRFGGTAPESEPETRALADLCRSRVFRHVVALHSQGEEIYWRYGDHTPVQSHMMAEVLGLSSGYRVADPEGLASHGGFKDWFIDQYSRPGFTIELGKGENPLPLEEFEPLYAKAREMLLLAALL